MSTLWFYWPYLITYFKISSFFSKPNTSTDTLQTITFGDWDVTQVLAYNEDSQLMWDWLQDNTTHHPVTGKIILSYFLTDIPHKHRRVHKHIKEHFLVQRQVWKSFTQNTFDLIGEGCGLLLFEKDLSHLVTIIHSRSIYFSDQLGSRCSSFQLTNNKKKKKTFAAPKCLLFVSFAIFALLLFYIATSWALKMTQNEDICTGTIFVLQYYYYYTTILFCTIVMFTVWHHFVQDVKQSLLPQCRHVRVIQPPLPVVRSVWQLWLHQRLLQPQHELLSAQLPRWAVTLSCFFTHLFGLNA